MKPLVKESYFFAYLIGISTYLIGALPTPKVEKKDPQQISNATTRAIIVKNEITRTSQGKSYLGMHYLPTAFSISVNKNEIAHGEKKELIVENDTITICYEYQFKDGKVKGAKEVLFKLDPKQKQHTITFSWDDQWRLALSDAKPVSCKELYKKWGIW